MARAGLSAPQRAAAHPESSAAQVGSPAQLAAPGETAGVLRARLCARGPTDWDLVCVVDADRILLGTLSPAELLCVPDDAVLASVARKDRPTVAAGMDQERMASVALHHRAPAIPVVGDDGRLAGVVGPATLMDILRREHVEDLHRLAGISRESAQARQALQAPPLRRLRDRLPWLLAGLGGSALAAVLVSRFEHVLGAMPAIAFFVPGIVYLADAIGTQSESIAVRGLSLSHMKLQALFAMELRTGLLMGLLLGLLAFPLVWMVFRNVQLAAAVAAALGVASAVASVLGLAIPALLQRLGADPAYGSGPMATIVQDVLSLAIYFGCVSLVVLPAA